MSQSIIDQVEAKFLKADPSPVQVGDTVDVHCRIIEGDKERIQVFAGVVIAIKGHGVSRNVTVRRIVANEGVERIFPLHSPRVAKIEIKRHGHVRRAKLYFLRERVGKARRLKDRRRGLGQIPSKKAKAKPKPEAVEAPVVEQAADASAETQEQSEA